MTEISSLDSLPVGRPGIVTEIRAAGAMGRRLTDLGMIVGTEVCRVHRSPFGDPSAYRIRGAVIALRRSTAGEIMVRWE